MKLKDKIKKIIEWCNDGLRRCCGAMSPDTRIIVIVSFIVVFGAANIYITVRAIYTIGRNDERQEQMKIEHIQRLELEKSKNQIPEFINQLIEEENERSKEQE